jgi:hypothetical protein
MVVTAPSAGIEFRQEPKTEGTTLPAKKATKKAAKKSASKRSMSADHKQALAEGRAQGKAVRDYLMALQTQKRTPGRKPSTTPEELQRRIDAETDPAKRLELVQRRLDVTERLANDSDEPDLDVLEARFVKVARSYAERKGISYTAFREVGVPAATLKQAGIPRTRRTT